MDEAVENTAQCGQNEELGFKLPNRQTATIDYLADVGGGLVENQRVSVFEGCADEASLETAMNPEEFATPRWVEIGELGALLENERDKLCPWFSVHIGRWDELNLPV